MTISISTRKKYQQNCFPIRWDTRHSRGKGKYHVYNNNCKYYWRNDTKLISSKWRREQRRIIFEVSSHVVFPKNLTPYLFLFMDPSTSSIIIETIIVAIIVVASYGIHSKLLNKDWKLAPLSTIIYYNDYQPILNIYWTITELFPFVKKTNARTRIEPLLHYQL